MGKTGPGRLHTGFGIPNSLSLLYPGWKELVYKYSTVSLKLSPLYPFNFKFYCSVGDISIIFITKICYEIIPEHKCPLSNIS